MNEKVYIRPLIEEDALVSYNWRNDQEVWKYTGASPDRVITPEMELQWIKEVMKRENEKRFAICIKERDLYIGNVQLTTMDCYQAEFHIFIGEKSYWNGGYGTAATNLMIKYAFENFNLQCIYLFVKKDNIAAIKTYEKAGFYNVVEDDKGNIKMALYKADRRKNLVSVFMMAYNHESYIKQAIEGILKQQNDFGIEIVIGEDCSSDNTRKVIIDYALQNPDLFKLILHERNVGANKNQLSVFNACKGKYIAMCEGDDYWTDPLKLQKQIDFLEKNMDYSICANNSGIITFDRELIIRSVNKDQTYTLNEILVNSKFETASIVFRNSPKIIFPRWFATYGFDIDALVFWILKDGHKAYVMKDAMSIYRHHTGGVTKKNNYRQKVEYYIGMLDRFNESTSGKYERIISAKKLSIYTRFNIYLLNYPERIAFLLRNTLNYLTYPGGSSLTLKLLIKYLLPYNLNKP